MPPAPGQKGTGKKNSAAMQKQSRNSTPVPTPASALPPQEFYDPDYLDTRVILFSNLSFDNLVDQSASSAPVPESRSVDAMLEKLKTLVNIMEKRSTFYDRGMRYLADERKKRPEDMRIDVRDQDSKKSKHKRKKGTDTAGDGTSLQCYTQYSKRMSIRISRDTILTVQYNNRTILSGERSKAKARTRQR